MSQKRVVALERRKVDAGWLPAFDDLTVYLEDHQGPNDFVLNVHPDKAVRDAAQACSLRWADFGSSLGQNEKLYRALQKAPQADAIDAEFVRLASGQFEDSGVALPKAKRERAKQILDKLTELDQVKVVILGQDPYHGPGQAHGLCFSVQNGVAPPPSLVNIYKELHSDIGMPIPPHGNLTRWAEQGVLLLNASLPVRANEPMSHSKIGWASFTDAVIRKVSAEKEKVVFILWGKFAQEKQALIDETRHFVLKAAHPSPLSAHNGFFGCRHFSKTNQLLVENGIDPIDWSLT